MVWVLLLGRERGDVDDHPGTLGPGRRQERLDQRRHAEDVGLVLPVDLLHAGALERSHLVIPGVVHQAIHPAELPSARSANGTDAASSSTSSSKVTVGGPVVSAVRWLIRLGGECGDGLDLSRGEVDLGGGKVLM